MEPDTRIKKTCKNRFSNWTEWLDEKGLKHSVNDLPALIFHLENGEEDKYWYKNGLQHRECDKPASILSNGNLFWFINDKRHRKNGPAIIRNDGTKGYYVNGQDVYPWFVKRLFFRAKQIKIRKTIFTAECHFEKV